MSASRQLGARDLPVTALAEGIAALNAVTGGVGSTIDIAELLDCNVNEEWVPLQQRKSRVESGRSGLLQAKGGPRNPKARFAGRPWCFKGRLPLPGVIELDSMENAKGSSKYI